MKFPLKLTFKIASLSPQISVTDAEGMPVCFVRQKVMKLREAIEVFSDKKRSEKISDIKADKIFDVSATYQFTDPSGQPLGSVSRKGMRSIWKAHYDIRDCDNNEPDMIIREERPWVKMVDGFVDGIPVVGAVSRFFLHPSYLVTSVESEKELVRIRKERSFFESKFSMEKLGEFSEKDEMRILLSTLMLVLLEKDRG